MVVAKVGVPQIDNQRPDRRNSHNGAGKFTEEVEGKINFEDISSQILEKVIQYFYFKLKYTNRTSEEIPEFQIDPEIALELLMAANFLDA